MRLYLWLCLIMAWVYVCMRYGHVGICVCGCVHAYRSICLWHASVVCCISSSTDNREYVRFIHNRCTDPPVCCSLI